MSEKEYKDLGTLALASVSTGCMLDDGSLTNIHEAVQWLAGHDVWTHELPHFLPIAAERLLAQHPELPTELSADPAEVQRDLLAKFGEKMSVYRVRAERTESPEDSLRRVAGDKPVIVITAPESEG